MLLHCGMSPITPVALQEYLPRIKDNDVLRAVEKNISGSRPKELFEEVLEDVDKQWETDRYCYGNTFPYMPICGVCCINVQIMPSAAAFKWCSL